MVGGRWAGRFWVTFERIVCTRPREAGSRGSSGAGLHPAKGDDPPRGKSLSKLRFAGLWTGACLGQEGLFKKTEGKKRQESKEKILFLR